MRCGDWTPQSSAENMTGCLGLNNLHPRKLTWIPTWLPFLKGSRYLFQGPSFWGPFGPPLVSRLRLTSVSPRVNEVPVLHRHSSATGGDPMASPTRGCHARHPVSHGTAEPGLTPKKNQGKWFVKRAIVLLSHFGPWNKSLFLLTKYVIPKSLKVSHWLGKL